jgi:hypothetical protein
MATFFERILGDWRYLRDRWPVLLHDALAVPAAWLGAYWFRFNLDQIPDIFLNQALAMLPLVLIGHVVFFVIFGVHRGAWRFTSTHDLSVILKSVLVGTGVVATVIFFVTGLVAVPGLVFPLHGLFLIALLVGARIVYRLFRDIQVRRGKGKRILIVGADAAGDMLRRVNRTHEPLIVLFLFLVVLCYGFWGTFTGEKIFFNGDNIWWYGTFQFFIESASQGVIPFWNPFSHGGEPFFFMFSHFRLIDPLILIPVIITWIVDVDLLSLFHLYYCLRVFIYLLGVYVLIRSLFTDPKVVILTMLLFLSVENFYAIFASFFHLDNKCWVPWFLHSVILAYRTRQRRYFLSAGLFLGIFIGGTTYMSIFFGAFIGVFISAQLLLERKTILDFAREEALSIVLGAGVVLLLSLPLLAVFLEKDTILPVTRVYGARESLDVFLEHHVYHQTYKETFDINSPYAGNFLVWENVLKYIIGRGNGPDTLFHIFVFLAILRVWFPYKRTLLITCAAMLAFALASHTPIYFVFYKIIFFLKMIRHTVGYIDIFPVIKCIFAAYGIQYFLNYLSLENKKKADLLWAFLLVTPFVIQMLFKAHVEFLGGHSVKTEDISLWGVALILVFPCLYVFLPRKRRFVGFALMGLVISPFTLTRLDSFTAPRSSVQSHFDKEDFRLKKFEFNDVRLYARPNAGPLFYESLITQNNYALDTVLDPPDCRPAACDSIYLGAWKGGSRGNRAIYWPFDYTYIYLLGEERLDFFNDLMGVNLPILRYFTADQVSRETRQSIRGKLRAHYRDSQETLSTSALFLMGVKPRNSEGATSDSSFSFGVKKFDPNSLVLDVTSEQTGYLLFNDTYSQHWRAYLDGVEIPIYRSNIQFKSVWLPAGENQTLAFHYSPTFYRFTLWIYVLTFLGSLLYFGLEARKSSRAKIRPSSLKDKLDETSC